MKRIALSRKCCIIMLLMLFSILSVSSVSGASYSCYQETANISTTCGGLSTGTYAYSGNWINQTQTYDADYNTYGIKNKSLDFSYISNFSFSIDDVESVAYCNNRIYLSRVDAGAGIYEYYLNGTATGFSFATTPETNSVRGLACDDTYFWTGSFAGTQIIRKWYLNGTYTGFNFTTINEDNIGNITGIELYDNKIYVLKQGGKVFRYLTDGTYDNFYFNLTTNTSGVTQGLAYDGYNFFVSVGINITRYNNTGNYIGGYTTNSPAYFKGLTKGETNNTLYAVTSLGANKFVFKYNMDYNTTNLFVNYSVPSYFVSNSSFWQVKVKNNSVDTYKNISTTSCNYTTPLKLKVEVNQSYGSNLSTTIFSCTNNTGSYIPLLTTTTNNNDDAFFEEAMLWNVTPVTQLDSYNVTIPVYEGSNYNWECNYSRDVVLYENWTLPPECVLLYDGQVFLETAEEIYYNTSFVYRARDWFNFTTQLITTNNTNISTNYFIGGYDELGIPQILSFGTTYNITHLTSFASGGTTAPNVSELKPFNITATINKLTNNTNVLYLPSFVYNGQNLSANVLVSNSSHEVWYASTIAPIINTTSEVINYSVSWLLIEPVSLTSKTINQTGNHIVYSLYNSNCSLISNPIVMNYTIQDIVTEASLSADTEVYFNLSFTGGYSKILSTSFTQQNNFSLCFYPDTTAIIDGKIQVTNSSYAKTNIYYIDRNLENVSEIISMIKIADATQVAISVVDEFNSPVSNAVIQISKLTFINGTYTYVNGVETGVGGTANAFLQAYETYRFDIYTSDGVLRKSESFELSTNTLAFKISLTESPLKVGDTLDLSGLYTALVFDNSTNTINLYINNTSPAILQVCLKVINTTNSQWNVLANNCTNNSIATLSYAGINNTVNSYIALAVAYHNEAIDQTNIYVVDSISIVKEELVKMLSKENVFLSSLLFLVIISIGLWTPAGAMLMMLVWIVFVSYSGLMAISFTITIGIVGLILMFVLTFKKAGN